MSIPAISHQHALIPLNDGYKPLPHETFFGYLDTPQDALVLMQSARMGGLGSLPRVKSRLTVAERSAIRSGSIFVFDQEESNIKRWTDGMNWSPSRIHNGCFLIYRQIVKPEDNLSSTAEADASTKTRGPFLPGTPGLEVDLNEPGFNAQLRDSMVVKKNGMVKKTISLEFEGRHVHVISYYNKFDVLAGRLPIPARTDLLGRVLIPAELKDTLLKNSLTKTVPISKETVGSLNGIGHLGVPTRHQSDGALTSGNMKIRSRSRGISPHTIHHKTSDRSLNPYVPDRSNSANGIYLAPPSPVGINAPTFEALIGTGSMKSRSKSPAVAIYSSSPPVDDSVRMSPYRQRRDSASSSGSSNYGSLRRRASSSIRNMTASPLLDSAGSLIVKPNGSISSMDGWDGTPPVSALPSPTGSDSNSVGALTTAFRFEITAPDDEPGNLRASPNHQQKHFPSSPSMQSVISTPDSISFINGNIAHHHHHNNHTSGEALRRQSSDGSFSSAISLDSTSSNSSLPSLAGPDTISPSSRPTSPADANFAALTAASNSG
ncbi:hypothetical protein HDU67_001468, partial [Dinochytrium kinnereticum]